MNSSITVAEALAVRSAISRRISQLSHERELNSMSVIEKGEVAEYPSRTVDMITSELNRVMADFRRLDLLIAISNTTTVIQWNNGELKVLEAIELAKQTRNESAYLSQLGSRKKLERQLNRGTADGGKSLFTVALYDPEAYMELAKKKEREATKLSSLIEQSNHLNHVDFDATEYTG
ncbi:hypothetical protein [Paenibacillus pinihumi]|uniref:hypothetical protein n=1 Tax=Paenibacillus pinihumi TaxID=669462 RepID=UPI0003FF1B77|nr:hypothetical protein [Paenibacillus pinihumi]